MEKMNQNPYEKNQARLIALFDAITDLVFMADSEFNPQLVNKQFDFEGKKCYEAFCGLKSPCKECLVDEVRHTKKPAQAERRIGGKIYLAVFYPILNDDGEVSDVIEVAREITKEKEIEQSLIQSDRLISLGSLVSGIAHEINNPNTFIRGNLSIINESMKEILPILEDHAKKNPDFKIARLPFELYKEKILTLIADMQGGADKIMNIVADLRKFARKDEGLLTEEIDINVILESSLRLVHNQIKRIANVERDLAADLPILKGNVQKIEQVVVNIIINAAQAIEEQRRDQLGTIRIQSSLEGQRWVKIRITDDGPGMTDDVKKRVFDPFFTTKRNKSGTGLGLSIAFGFIEEHNGLIGINSELDVGTEFIISLPVNQPQR